MVTPFFYGRQRLLDVGAVEIFDLQAEPLEALERRSRIALRELFVDASGNGPAAIVDAENIPCFAIHRIKNRPVEFGRRGRALPDRAQHDRIAFKPTPRNADRTIYRRGAFDSLTQPGRL